MSGNEGQPAVSQKIVEFIQSNRKPIYVAAIAIAVAMVGSVAGLIIADAVRGRAIAAVEDLGVRYAGLRDLVSPEGERPGGLDELLADLRSFAARRSGYAGGRAWSMVASIHGRLEEWAEAEAAWLSAARATSRSYMAPIAYFNAAVAAEEQGRAEEAISHYASSIAAPAGFFAAPRAQFSIGRLREEALGDYPAAIEAYRDVVSGWPNDMAWANLARSRIIALETMGYRLEPGERVVRPALFGGGGDFADWTFAD